jgi:hypothetical protein
LRDNPKFAQVGRYAIAMEICTKHWSEISQAFGRKDIIQRDYSIPSNLSWVRNLINQIREGADSALQLSDNRLFVVTFNYDISLELCLDAQFDNTEVHRGAKWEDCLNIFHVYGKVAHNSHKEFDRQQFLNNVSKSALQIDVIGQAKDSNFSERLSKIQSAIGNSQRVIVAGFSFDEANSKLLNLESSGIGSKMLVHNFNGDKGLERVLDRLGVPVGNRIGPFNAKELSIADADGQGLFRPD